MRLRVGLARATMRACADVFRLRDTLSHRPSHTAHSHSKNPATAGFLFRATG